MMSDRHIRKSVEHLGPQHEMVNVIVAPGVVMKVCPEFEIRRFEFMRDILKTHGKVFANVEFDTRYPTASVSARCYDEAAALMESHGLIYCEGIMLTEPAPGVLLPMPHAWCCTSDGKLVDPTAHRVQHKTELVYLGIEFKSDYVRKWHSQFGFHGLLDGHPDLGDSVGVYVDPIEEWGYGG